MNKKIDSILSFAKNEKVKHNGLIFTYHLINGIAVVTDIQINEKTDELTYICTVGEPLNNEKANPVFGEGIYNYFGI